MSGLPSGLYNAYAYLNVLRQYDCTIHDIRRLQFSNAAEFAVE